jgi:2-phospho-L-lactate guanylyltransferase
MRALAESAALDAVVVVTADPMAADAAAARGFVVMGETKIEGHVAAARLGIARAEGLGATRVLLVPGDCPLLRGADVDALLRRHPGPGVVIVPDRHGDGTNALLLAPPRAIVPSFGPGSRARHERLAAEAGVACAVDAVASLAHDVDTADDLAALRPALRASAVAVAVTTTSQLAEDDAA